MTLFKQVCVEPPSSALKMTLSAFAAEHRPLQHAHLDLDTSVSCDKHCVSRDKTDWRLDHCNTECSRVRVCVAERAV